MQNVLGSDLKATDIEACVVRAGNDGGIRGDRLIERVKAFFGGAEQRYDPYFDDADDDSFAQADFSRG